MKVFSTLTLLCALTFFLGLATADSALASRTDPMGGTGGGPINGELQVTVVYDGTTDPIAGAFVMVGASEASWGNWGTTDGNGQIVFTDYTLIGPTMVTAGAEGMRYFTLVDVDAAEIVIPLRPISIDMTEYQVGDYVSGVDVDNGWAHFGDGYLDMAFVLPAFTLANLMSFDMDDMLGPPEIIEILGDEYEVPSNLFIPQQWEVFIEINKDHYYLYLPGGEHTIAALSGRIDVDALSGGEMADLIGQLDWREIDVLDVNITGDTNSADLNVGPDLNETVTINLGNVPGGSSSFCISLGDLDGHNGLGRLVPLGLNAFACAEGGDCSGTVNMTTTAASGEFANMGYHALVATSIDATDDVLVIVRREDHPQNYTENISDFFSLLDLGYADAAFAWNDVTNTGNGSPGVDIQISALSEVDGEAVYWEFMAPGNSLGFTPPTLPAAAPPALADGGDYTWGHASLALAFDLDNFDFDSFSSLDLFAHGSHMAIDETNIVYEVNDGTGVGDDGIPRMATILGNWPNPFNPRTTLRFQLANSADVDLGVYSIDGRRIATVASGVFGPGHHDAIWNGCDSRGRSVTSGVYLARLEAGGETSTWRMLLLK